MDIHQHRILGGLSNIEVESLPLTPVTFPLFTSYFSLCAGLEGCRTLTTAESAHRRPDTVTSREKKNNVRAAQKKRERGPFDQ